MAAASAAPPVSPGAIGDLYEDYPATVVKTPPSRYTAGTMCSARTMTGKEISLRIESDSGGVTQCEASGPAQRSRRGANEDTELLENFSR